MGDVAHDDCGRARAETLRCQACTTSQIRAVVKIEVGRDSVKSGGLSSTEKLNSVVERAALLAIRYLYVRSRRQVMYDYGKVRVD